MKSQGRISRWNWSSFFLVLFLQLLLSFHLAQSVIADPSAAATNPITTTLSTQPSEPIPASAASTQTEVTTLATTDSTASVAVASSSTPSPTAPAPVAVTDPLQSLSAHDRDVLSHGRPTPPPTLSALGADSSGAPAAATAATTAATATPPAAVVPVVPAVPVPAPAPVPVYLPDNEDEIVDKTFFHRGEASDTTLPLSAAAEAEKKRLDEEAAARELLASANQALLAHEHELTEQAHAAALAAQAALHGTGTHSHSDGHPHHATSHASHHERGTHASQTTQHAATTASTTASSHPHHANVASTSASTSSVGSSASAGFSSSSSPHQSRPLPPPFEWNDFSSIVGRAWFTLNELDDLIQAGVETLARSWKPSSAHSKGSPMTGARQPTTDEFGRSGAKPSATQSLSLSVYTQEIQIYLFLVGLLCMILLSLCICAAWGKYQPAIQAFQDFHVQQQLNKEQQQVQHK